MEKEILDSWKANAQNWIQSIRDEEIISRKVATNQAIIDTLIELNCTPILDVGCGEGWLTRKLNQLNINTVGIDAIEDLIVNARNQSSDEFLVASYQDIFEKKLNLLKKFELAVMNFSLIGKESTEQIIAGLHNYLTENGKIVLQTLHPFSVIEYAPYQSAWLEDGWKGLPERYSMPYRWYFRTISDWLKLLRENRYELEELKEPLNPTTQKPASLILVARINPQ
jgi:2-polyprenyl-3-methyl-5-hydroxy-6-metoxy-1,4-benzoquinol methylase